MFLIVRKNEEKKLSKKKEFFFFLKKISFKLNTETSALQRRIPAYSDAGLSLRLFHFLVVIGFEFDERTKDVLILIRVLIAQQHWMRIVVGARLTMHTSTDEHNIDTHTQQQQQQQTATTMTYFGQVFECGRVVLLPQLFQFVDLRGAHRTHSGVGRRHSHEPRQEGAVVNQRQPLFQLPIHVLETSTRRTRLATQQHHHRLGLNFLV